MEKLPNHIRLQFVDGKSGKLIEIFQETVYDNLPLYCNYCKHQGHDEDSCCLISKRNQNNKQIDDTIEVALRGTIDSEKYQGDVREILNGKRKIVDVDQSKATSLDQQLVAATSEKNHADSMDVDTIGSGQKLMDSGQKLMDTFDVEDAENSGQHVEKKQDISNASRDLLCSNNFDALLKTTGKQVRLIENDNDLIQEKQVSPPALNSKLSPEASVFVPKCVIAKKNESRILMLNTMDLGEDSLDEDEEDNMLDI
ncbi:hypothetical protein H5410_037535 [Solanum commersonii]|uniref:NB-ARC domain containing protein n=1 Tax=Solanum commersonii TaxID=4109 RepID=A0A9J5Y8Q9_SOLCO|nr:hypothetical protein H5410_037535 [Solanum commersonii]